MAENCKALKASPHTPLGTFSASPTALLNFLFVKIINAFYWICPIQDLRLPTTLNLPELLNFVVQLLQFFTISNKTAVNCCFGVCILIKSRSILTVYTYIYLIIYSSLVLMLQFIGFMYNEIKIQIISNKIFPNS